MDIKTIVQNMIDAGESEENIAKVIQSLSPKKVKEEKTIVHADVLDMETEVSDGWLGMEEDAAKFFTKHYQNQGLNVGFKQAKVGHNALQMQVNGEDFGEIITLHQGGKAMDFGEIQKHIQFKIDDAAADGTLGEEFGDKESSTKRTTELLNIVRENPELLNMLESDDTGEGRAELSHGFDKAQGLDVQFDGRINYDSWGNEVDVFDKFGNRRSHEGKNVLTKGKEVIGEVFGAISGEGYDQYIGDLSGGVELEDGTYIPYSYIWDRRKELLQLKQEGFDGLTKEYVKKGDKLVETFSYSENSDIDLLYNKKISEEGFGSEGALDEYVGDNAFIYFSPGEQEIRLKHIELEGIEDEAEREVIKADINKKWKELYPSLSDSDIEDLTLYDKDGNFIRIKKPKIEQRGDVTEEETLIENEANELARENIKDLDYLVKKRQEAYLRLILLAKRVSGNKDKVSDQTNWYAKQFGEMFDFSNDALIKDLSQLESIAKFEDIFAISDALGEGRTLKDIDIGILNPNLGSDGKPSKYNITNETLSNLPGGSALAEEYNKALLDFKVLSRSVDLNLDINQTPEENIFAEITDDFGKSVFGAGIISEVSQDEVRDAYRGILEHDGYGELQPDGSIKMPEHVIESSFWKNGRLGKNNATRDNIESGAEIVTDLAPLLIELAVFKKLGGLKKLQTTLGSAKNAKGLRTGLIGRLTNGKRFQGKVPRFLVDKMIAPGVITAAEWAAAESLGELATGGAWKAHTIDWEKGETNLTMPIAMGMSAGAFGAFSAAAMKGFERYVPGGKRFLANVKNEEAWHNATNFRRGVKKGIGVPFQMAGQGATATALLVTAETAQAITDDLIADGKVDWAAKWKNISDTDHLIQTWIGMTILSGKDVVPKAREAYRADVARLRRNTEATEKAYKELGVDKNSTEAEIDQAAERKIKEIEGSKRRRGRSKEGLTNPEVKAKVEEIKKAQKDLQSDLRIKDAKAAAISAGKYYEEWVKPNYERMQNIKNKPPEEWTIDDYNAINDLTFDQMYDVLRRSGMEPNTTEFKLAENIHANVKHLNEIANALDIDAKLPEFREEYIRNTLSININDFRIKQLKKIIKDGDNVGLAKLELKKLEETNKIILEKNITLDKRAGVEYEVRLKAEVAAAKVLAESLGGNIKTYTAKEWKEKGYKEAEASYDPTEGELHLNLDRIRETGNLGAPIHEVIHHILRNSLKGKDGKISKKGMEIIDGLMQKFSPKEREIIQKRIDDNYKFEDFESKEVYDTLVKERKIDPKGVKEVKENTDGSVTIEYKKGEYYEEYVTSIGDAIKNKQIKYDQSKWRKIGKLIYPILKPLMPNLYKYDLSQTSSAKATKDLFNMIGDVHFSSSSKRVREGLKEVSGEGPGSRKDVAESKSKDIFADKRVSEDLGLTTRTKDIVAKNTKLYKEVVKNAKEKGIPIGKDAVTQKIKNDLVTNNLPRVSALAKQAAKRGTEIGLEEGLRKGYEDFYQEYALKLVELSRTWNPAKNKDFGAYMNDLLPKKYSGILKELKKGEVEAKSMTDPEVAKKAEATAGGIEKSKEILEKTKSKLKKFILERNALANTGVSSKQLTNKVKKTIENAFRTSGDIKATAKNKPRLFLENLEKSFEIDLWKDIKNSFGTREVYKDFIDNSYEMVKTMPLKQLVKAEMDFAYEPVIDPKTGKQKRMTTTEMFEAGYPLGKVGDQVKKIIEDKKLTETERKEELKKLDKTRSGPAKWKQLKFTEKQYKSWAKGEGINPKTGKPFSASVYGTRKDALARMFSIELTKDAVPSVVKNPFQQAYDLGGNPIPGKTIDVLKDLSLQQKDKLAGAALLAEVNNIVDRSPGMKFSVNKKRRQEFILEMDGKSIPEIITNFELPKNKDILDHYNKIVTSKDITKDLYSQLIHLAEHQGMYDLRKQQREETYDTEMVREFEGTDQVAVTAKGASQIIKEYNKKNLLNKIPEDGLKFMLDSKEHKVTWSKKSKTKAEQFYKGMGDLFDILPKEFIENNKILNLLLRTAGHGSLRTYYKTKPDGSLVSPLKAKVMAKHGLKNDAWMLLNLKKKPKGMEGIEIPTFKDGRSFLDAIKITKIGDFKGGRFDKGTLKQDGLLQFQKKNGLYESKKTKKSKEAYLKKLQEFSDNLIAEKGFTANQTREANKWMRDQLIKGLVEYVFKAKPGKELAERSDFFHKFFQIQTNIGEGMIKGTNTIRYVTLEKATSPAEITRVDKSGFHAEHAFFNLAHTATVSRLLNKHKKSKDVNAFMKDYDLVSKNLEQYIITEKHRQKNEGRQPNGEILGNTEFFKGGNADPMLNVLSSDPRKAFTTFDLKTGEIVGERISKDVKLGGPEAVSMLESLSRIENNAASQITRGEKNYNELYDATSRALEKTSPMVFSKSKTKDLTLNQKLEIARNTDKAMNLGKLIGKEKKGMSAWDFDDTLAITKSGVRAKIPNPEGTPKPSRKVIFLAGGAGSGKSNVVKKLNLEKQGFKIVNQDISLEWLKKNSGLPENMNDLTREQRSTLGTLQHQARGIAKRKMMKYQGNADGVVVDGTGGSVKAMQGLVKEFKDRGYDASMLFVETSLETALKRNRARKERSLLDKIVEKNHEAVQSNKQAFGFIFRERFMEVKTDKLKQEDPMPQNLVDKMNDFVSSYENRRLDAEEFAVEGKDILDKGGKFDFEEFNVVTKGEKGPFFQKALDRVKKFGSEHQYVITARPPEAQVPIHEFLKSQGLNIPLENIKGLGNSTGEAKAMWMLEKFSEGYNDMYFADDALGNVKAVREVLNQLDVKYKIQQAMRGEDAKIESKESVKDIDRLDAPENYNNIKYSKSHRSEYEKTISKHRSDLVKEGKVSQTIDAMFDFVDGLNVPGNKKRKYEQVTTKWLATSNIKLGEDAYKIQEAVELAEKHKEDIFSYTNPNAIIEKYAGKAKAKPTDPNTVKEFAKGAVTNKKHGITEHVVENTKEGQLAVRKVMDTHFGENSNPWCLAQKKDGKLTEGSRKTWEHYSDGPKSMVFQNGKLIGFKANGQYWDRMDNATDAPVVRIKDGRVTKTVELVPIGEGKVQEFVMETRTTSKDKKTVTTEYHVERSLDAEGYYFHPAGTKVVENKVNGITTKETVYKPNGKTRRITKFEGGKEIESRSFQIDGKTTMSINRGKEIDVKKHGDFISHEITETAKSIDYWYGEALISGKATEIGFKTPKGFEVMDIMKRVDGKLRVNFDKLRKIDPDVKGLPKEITKKEPQFKFSKNKKNLSKDFNKILEEVKGIGKEKTFSAAKGALVGKGKGKYKIFGTPGAEDFAGLVTYAFAGKGKQGEMHKKFFEENLQKPFNRAYNDIHSRKQNISNDYKALRKAMPEVRSRLNETVDGVYTIDNAIRVHLWNKAGMEIPGLSKTDLKTLTDFVRKDGELTLFAEQLSQITMLKEGYLKPSNHWLGENLTIDMNSVVDRVYRKEALTEFVENREAIFGKWEGGRIVGENMNKIEAAYGPKHREALENMLWRMENGTNRRAGADSNTNKWMNWVNSATGTIMFFNQKSAALQTISSLNYVNGTFNNPLRAAQAFANQKQYWADFVKIFGSDMMVQRRSGLKINIEANELIERVGSGEGGFAKFRAYLLEKGFIPTKYADSFAIASGGATYYRNSIRKYEKEGLSTKEAEKKAWEDFTEMTEATQQSSRPDLISMQQASALGRPILAFANTPMQMFRRHKRRIQDIANNRGNMAENVGSALYYGFAQTLLFSYLANAMFAVDDESDDPKDIGFAEEKKSRHINTIADSYLRGMGTGGASVAALKNGIMSFMKESKKDSHADYGNTIIDMLNVSPPIGSKARKLYSAGKSYMYDKEAVREMGLDFDNPATMAIANVISAFTNMPTDRAVMKIQNIRDASMGDFENWQRIAMLTGVNKWQLGVGEKGPGEIRVEEVETRVKEEKKTKKKETKQQEKIQENQVLENQFKKEQDKEKKQGKKDITCSSVVKGRRCNKKVKGKGGKCTIHENVEMHSSGKSIQCRLIKSNGVRCKVVTYSKSGFCYYHD